MDDILSEYLSVPLDLALCREINLFDWARNKLANEKGLVDDPGIAPNYFLSGKKVSPKDIERHRTLAAKYWEEVNEGRN